MIKILKKTTYDQLLLDIREAKAHYRGMEVLAERNQERYFQKDREYVEIVKQFQQFIRDSK